MWTWVMKHCIFRPLAICILIMIGLRSFHLLHSSSSRESVRVNYIISDKCNEQWKADASVVKADDNYLFHWESETAKSNDHDYYNHIEENSQWKMQLVLQSKQALVAGKKVVVGKKNFLSIGIATVYREENYLGKTLSSLIQESDEEERQDVVVVIHLADTFENNARQLAFIKQNFQQYLDCGFFQVIESSEKIYPPMDFVETKRTFNDSKERVLWRTKQVIDFAFLFTYSKTLAEYFMILEDDIIAAPQFLTAIRDFINARKYKRWTALEFTGFHGIGLLFHTKDLPRLAQLLLMFHQDQPVDMLMRHFINLHVPDGTLNVRRNPSIFQHIGVKSTLLNKVQPLNDSTFSVVVRKYPKNRNPKATLVTSMRVHHDFIPEYAYKSTPGYFCGVPKFPYPNETFDIIFPTPLRVSRILVISGIHDINRTNAPTVDAHLELSRKFVKMLPNNSSAICRDFKRVAYIKNGIIDYNLSKDSLRNGTRRRRTNLQGRSVQVQCIRIRIGPEQKHWVVIREIQIFRKDSL